MPSSPARVLAFAILQEMEGRRVTLDERLAREDAEALDPRDRAFLHELVLGTLRRRGAIDHALGQLSARPLDRLGPEVRAALRLGAHQLLHLRVPPHAAVSESVTLVRSTRPKAAGFVNAILRRLAREGPPAEVDAVAEPREWLTTAGSLPSWLADRWLARLGPAIAVARARALLREPPVFFRPNPRVPDAMARAQEGGLAPRPALVPGAWVATSGHIAALAREGVVYPQDEGSQLVAHLAAGHGRVLDACAAPGGKATLMADLAGEDCRVVAAELAPRRLLTLGGLVRRWGARNVHVLGADALHPPFRVQFDSVLLDAPCSGLGTLSRHPDLRWRFQPKDLAWLAERQLQLLASVAALVKPGGRLLYAVCSIEPEENEGVLAPFLAAHGDFTCEPLPTWASAFADGPFVRMRPEIHEGDAFFAARLRRT
ncbi:MAG: transcription antitermination factor NusB [Solirubrobacterales bacterium]